MKLLLILGWSTKTCAGIFLSFGGSSFPQLESRQKFMLVKHWMSLTR